MTAVLAQVAASDARTWERKPLAEVADILDGKRIPVNAKEREKRPGHVPYYGATGQVGCIDDFLFDEELVLLGEDGAPFLEPNKPKAYVIRGKSWVNNHAHVLRARAVPTGWLAHYLNVVRYDGLVTGTTRLKLTQAAMRRIRVPVAPWHVMEQRVAEIEKQFSRLDEAVASLKRVKANLKRYKAAVLKAAVEGRLVPTEAELARRERRGYETGEQLLRRIVEFRSDDKGRGSERYKLSWEAPTDAPLPVGWVWANYGQVGRLQLGRQRSPKYHTGPNMRPYLRVQNVFEDRLDLSDVMEMDFPLADYEKYALVTGDLLLNEGQSPELLGRPAIYRGELPGACFTNTLIRLRAADGLRVEFALLVARHHMHAGRFVDEGSITTNIAHLSVGRLATVEFPLPPTAEQDRIVAAADRQLSIIAALEQSAILAELQMAKLRAAILKNSYSASAHTQSSEMP